MTGAQDEKHKASDAALRKLVACDWFEWMPGMKVESRGVQRRVSATWFDNFKTHKLWLGCGGEAVLASGAVPIPSDPATAGCLLELYVRDSKPDLALAGLSAARPSHDAYASFGDFLVAELLAGETS